MIVRPTARLVLLDTDGRILLFKIEDLTVFDPLDPRGADQPRVFWVTPGAASRTAKPSRTPLAVSCGRRPGSRQ